MQAHGTPRNSILTRMLRNASHLDEETAEVEEMCAGIAATVYNGAFATYLQRQTQTHKRLQLVLIP